jgi:hypothetical protein
MTEIRAASGEITANTNRSTEAASMQKTTTGMRGYEIWNLKHEAFRNS